MVAMFQNSTTGAGGDIDLQFDFAVNVTTNCTSLAQCMDQGTRGTVLQVDGFAGDLDEHWDSVITAVGGADPAIVRQLSGADIVATFNADLTTFFNIIGSGDIAFQNIFTGAPCPTGTVALDFCTEGPSVVCGSCLRPQRHRRAEAARGARAWHARARGSRPLRAGRRCAAPPDFLIHPQLGQLTATAAAVAVFWG